jgi:hypothetical protein
VNPSSQAVVVDGFSMVNETLMDGKSWEYHRRVYELWRIWDPWPPASLLQLSGPTERGSVTQAVWRDLAAEREYMSNEGVERFTEVARVLAEERVDPPADLLPVNFELEFVAFGPSARGFIDIGADLDEAAARQFGTVLTAVDLDYSALSAEQTQQLMDAAGLGATIPGDMVLRFGYLQDGALHETEVWRSEQAARAFVDELLQPEAARIAGTPEAIGFTVREVKRLAISSSGLDPARF